MAHGVQDIDAEKGALEPAGQGVHDDETVSQT